MLRGMWDLPGPGLEPVSPALAGGFSTTAPPGQSHVSILSQILFSYRLLQNIEFPVLYSRSLLIICFIYSTVYITITLVTLSLISKSVSVL